MAKTLGSVDGDRGYTETSVNSRVLSERDDSLRAVVGFNDHLSDGVVTEGRRDTGGVASNQVHRGQLDHKHLFKLRYIILNKFKAC